MEEKTNDELEDPMEYLENIYGSDNYRKEAIRIAGIDYDEAVDDAIATDGWAHFLSRYDGNYEELDSGKIIWRED